MGDLLIVGITGRSGSGKSSLLDYYLSLGYPGVDGDQVSRHVCEKDSACLRELVAAFGEDILAGDGTLRRGKLAVKAFATPESNQKLVEITHPHIQWECERMEQTARLSGAKLFFIDGAMIVGNPFEGHIDRLIVVKSDPRLALSRIILRDGISKQAAHNRLDNQLSEEELVAAADYVIDNNGSAETLRQKADEVLEALLREVEGR